MHVGSTCLTTRLRRLSLAEAGLDHSGVGRNLARQDAVEDIRPVSFEPTERSGSGIAGRPDVYIATAVVHVAIDVPVRALDDILVEAGAPAQFEFLSIDVEGHELEVLSGFNLARWRPRLILIEDHVANLDRHRLLTTRGYRLIRRCENNGWYVPRDAAVEVELRERWNIVRKYYLGLPFRIARNASRRLRQPFKDRRRARQSPSR